MKGTLRRGATLPMVIITVVLVAALIGILASMLGTGHTQTQRMYSFLNAKYVATSGSQLAMGAYNEGDGSKSPLYTEFSNRAEGRSRSTDKVTSSHEFSFGGRAEIEMSGDFANGSRAKEDYYITIKSRAKVAGSDDYYVHTVVFNWATSGIRSEKGGLEAKSTK